MAKKFTKLNLGDVVATSGGKSFRKLSTKQPDELAGTWVINNTPAEPEAAIRVDFASPFTAFGYSNNKPFSISYSRANPSSNGSIATHNGDWRRVYYWKDGSDHKAGWQVSDHTVTFPDGEYVNVSDDGYKRLLAWFKANATKVS